MYSIDYGYNIKAKSLSSGGLNPAAFVTEWTVGAGDTIKLPSYDATPSGYTMDYDVDWGDGNSDSNVTTADKTHTYTTLPAGAVSWPATFQVVITNQFGSLNMQRASATERGYLTKMVQWGTDNIWSSIFKMFYQCTAMQYTATDSPNLTNLVEKTDAREVFYNCDAVVNLDLSNWTNTGNLTYLYYAFGKMSALKTLNLTGWDTSNVTYNYNMCEGAGDTVDGCLFTMPDLDWSSCPTISQIFYDTKCAGIDISGWKFGPATSVAKICRQTHQGSAATPFTIDASGWLQSSNITNMQGMFRSSGVTSVDITGIDTSNVTNMNYFAYYATELTHITGLDEFDATSLTTALIMFQYTKKYNWGTANANFSTDWGPNLGNITTMTSWFYQTGYTTPGTAPVNVANWDTSSVTNMENIFRQAKWSGGSIDVSGWDVSSLTGNGMRFMFRETVGLTAGIDTSNWQISSNVTDMSNWAYYSDLGGDIDFSHASCDLSGITSWGGAFQGTGLTGFKLHASSSFAAITSMTNMFYVGTVLIPTADYDALLLRCAATCTSPTNDNVTLTATASTYTLGGAVEIARDDDLRTTLSWTINDAGGV
jgi:surface protein